jgi:arginyl-tRNA synthetase
MFDTERNILQNSIIDLLKAQSLNIADLDWNWIPFSGHWGFATTLFKISSLNKEYQKDFSVKDRAQHIAKKIAESIELPPGIEKVEAINGYLNFYFDSSTYAKSVLDEILSPSHKFGKGADTGKTVMVEFSQPNTHKAFHVGHLRNMVLGAAVSNIIEFAGNNVIRANYIGDIGLHVVRWLWNYSKYHSGETPPEDGKTRWMGASGSFR